MSGAVNSNRDVLAQEVQQLGLLHRSYTKTKGALGSCAKIAFSLTEAVLLGGYTPIKAVAVKSLGFVARLFAGQANATHHTRTGIVTSSFGEMRSIRIGGGEVNEEAVEEFCAAARAMQLPSIGIAPASASSPLAAYEGISCLPEQSVQCNPLIFYPKKVLKKSTQFMVDPRERHATHALVSNRSYLRFIAMQTAASIKGNTFLIMRVAQLGTFYISKVCVDSFAQAQEIDPASWSYAILTGLCAKVAGDTVGALVHRYFTRRADRHAVESTRDLKSAVECLKVLDAFPQEQNCLEKAVFPLSLLCNEQDKLLFAMPSYKSRIKELDPRGEFSAWEPPALETFEPKMSEEAEIARLQETRLVLRRDLQFAMGVKENGNLLITLSPHLAFSLTKKLGLAYFRRSLGWKALAAVSLCGIFVEFYPGLNPKLGQPSPHSMSQTQVTAIAQRMGIKKPVYVYMHPRDSLQACATPYVAHGVGSGPGHAVINVPPHKEFAKFEGFIFSHEVAHLKHGDGFTNRFVQIGALLGCNLLLDNFFNPTTHLETLVQGVIVSSTAKRVKSAVIRRCEARADMTAISSAPMEERGALIQQGVDFLNDLRSKELVFRSQTNVPKLLQLYRKIIISPEGDNRLDTDHPPHTARIHALEELRKKSA